jgi:hypothetical protein
MDIKQAKTLQSLCEKYNAYGCEVWFVGIRFYLNNGKMSKIISRKGLSLETGTVWVTLNSDSKKQKGNYKNVSLKIHPDISTDKEWGTRIFQNMQRDLFHESEWRYGLHENDVTDILSESISNKIRQKAEVYSRYNCNTPTYDTNKRKQRYTQQF